jgi:PhnB protein
MAEDWSRLHGFAVVVSMPSIADARRVFDALADGGSVQMAFQKTSWAEGYGFVTDRFGVPWEIAA